ncbi:DUF6544 family protein [Pseudonocardia bannensis]|uniref:Uncharacterized protein n=1 Tax=Pseudonocardia bannensis TaxID=630973 RepID=A0A848DF38_9PSEU|nr:DUF6544 family protein [Pseudonocardia bannensis]NMH91227.1 hypothetical protein [Pseudonocardia bannensis]
MPVTALRADPPRHLAGDTAADWARLVEPTPQPAIFDPAMVAPLPTPARRWVEHAIAPGTPLLRVVVLDMHGRIRIGSWRPYRARQVLTVPHGFVWAAATRVAGLPVRGFDRYTRGSGQMRWLLGALPVQSGAGPDITRSAAARLAGEFIFTPAAALDPVVRWEPLDDRHAVARVSIGPFTHPITLRVGPAGALESVSLPRWGNPDGTGFAEHPFTALVHEEARFDGFTVPARLSAGWWNGTDVRATGGFIQFTVDAANYR